MKSFWFFTCQDCDFSFTPDIDAEAAASLSCDLERLCQEGLPEAGWADPSFLEAAFAFMPERCLEILDFGAGESLIPDLLRGGGHRVIAVDIAPPLRPHPDRLTGDIRELDLLPGRFDLVYSFQVFEHLPEPRPLLDRLIELVRPGGILAIHTDMETEERHTAGFEHWWYVLPPHHCSFYRHKTFRCALDDTAHQLVHADPKLVCIKVASC